MSVMAGHLHVSKTGESRIGQYRLFLGVEMTI
jgi:hypothetical protein